MIERNSYEYHCCGPEPSGSLTQDQKGNDYRACIGKECAAWRWDESAPRLDGVRFHGYCGLAGKP